MLRCCLWESLWTLYLIKEQLSPLLSPKVHHLHCYLPAAVLLCSNTHHPCRSLPNLHKVLQIRPRITLVYHHLQGPLELFMGHLGWVWGWPGWRMLGWSKGWGACTRGTGSKWTCRWGSRLGRAVLSGVRRVGASRVSQEGIWSSGPQSHVRRQAQGVASWGAHCPLESDATHKRTAGASGQEAGVVPHCRLCLCIKRKKVRNVKGGRYKENWLPAWGSRPALKLIVNQVPHSHSASTSPDMTHVKMWLYGPKCPFEILPNTPSLKFYTTTGTCIHFLILGDLN